VTDSASAVAEYLKRPYHWVIFPDEKRYGAFVLELPGCFSGGDTPEEAVTELQDAMTVWIESELERGHDIPEPIDPEKSSGRLTFRIPPSLHYRAQLRAQLEGVSLNRLLSDAVSRYLGDALPVPSRQERDAEEPPSARAS
jgi:predicted RNase H-like HicB family nuclease